MALSITDQAMLDSSTAGFTVGSLADREHAYLTSKRAGKESCSDKARALGKPLTKPLKNYS